jgi:hypothetical protein
MPTELYTQDLNGRGSILRQRLAKYAEVSDHLSGLDELFLMQSVLQDQVEQYADALEQGKSAEKIVHGSIVNKHAHNLVKVKETLTKMEIMKKESISRETLFMWVKNIGELLWQTFGPDPNSPDPNSPELENKVIDVIAQIEGSILGVQTSTVKEDDLFNEAINTVPLIPESVCVVESNPAENNNNE